MSIDLQTPQAEGWRPEENDTLIGIVQAVSRGWSDQGEKFYPIVTISVENGTQKDGETVPAGTDIAIHGFHFALGKRMIELQPVAGERVGIKMGAKVPTKDGKRTVQTYTFKVEGRDVDVWGSFDAPAPTKTGTVQEELPTTSVDDDDIPF